VDVDKLTGTTQEDAYEKNLNRSMNNRG